MSARKVGLVSMLLLAMAGNAWSQEKPVEGPQRTPDQVLAGTITSGAASWALTSTTWTSTGTGPSHNFLIGAQDQVFQDWWWYRLSTDTREFTFPTPTTESYVGNTATLSWTNLNGTGLNAQLVVVVADAPARTTQTMTISNPTAAAVNISVFRYVDFDLNGTASADSAVINTSPTFMTVTDGAVSMPFHATGAANYAVSTFSAVRGQLADTAVNNFANTGLPFAPGDFTGGFQWAPQSIAAGASASYSSVYGTPPSAPAITLTKTVGTTPGVCAATDTITVPGGTEVYYCFQAQNTGNVPFNFHSLTDSQLGTVLTNSPVALAPGASSPQVIVPRTMTATTTNTATWTAASSLGYAVNTAAAFSYIPINATGTALNLTDDSAANIVSPFPITFYGTTSTNLRVGNNGGIRFNATTGSVAFANTALPSAAEQLTIYPYWDDLDATAGNVYWQVQGAAPNRQLIVEWFNRPHFSNIGSATFQVVISEGSNQIRFQYLDVDFGDVTLNNGLSATVGLGNTATAAQQVSFNQAVINNNQAILFTPEQIFTAQATDTATVTVVYPDINVSPLALNSTQLAGSSVTLPLTIGNVGQAPLNWTIAETFPDRPAATNAVAAPEPVFNVPAAVTSAKDCPAFANYPFSEPAGWAQFCGGGSPTPSSSASPAAPTSTGFALNLRTPDRNLKRFILNNFPGQTVVGAQAANIYGMDFNATATTLHALNVSTNELGTLNTTTGAFTSTVACAAPAGGTWTGLSIDPVSNVFYASTTVNLYTLNPTTCAPILVGPFGVAGGLMIDIAVNAAGAMYGHDIATDSIYSINKSTGAATLIGPTGIAANFAQGMDFDNETGTLYIFAYIGSGANRYGTVNLATGAVTVLASDNPTGEFEGATQTLGSCQPNDYSWLTVSPASGTTAPGASSVANVTLNATGLACGATYTAQLCVRSNDPTSGPGNGTNLVQVPVSMTVNCAADLTVTLTDSPDPVTAGTNLTYLATLTNNGPSDAQGATITLPIPAGTTLVSATPSAGGSCNAASPVICTWAGATAPAGVRTASIVVAVAPSQLANLSATATVSSSTTDPNPGNNSATATTTVITSADLVIGLTASTPQALANEPVTFTATSLNQGPSDAQNVSITVTLTPDFRFTSVVATGATCTAPQVGTTGAITCTWTGATAPGVTRTMTVVAFSNAEGQTAVNASTTSNTFDPVANNNSATVFVQVGYLLEEIPTLSGLGLLLMGLMIGLVGFVAVRRQA